MIDENELGAFLLDYADAWKSASVWTMASGEAAPDREAITLGYLRHLSRPSSPRETFQYLVSSGRYAAAQHLLHHPPFEEAIGDAHKIQQLATVLDHGRFDATMEIQVCWDNLARRAAAARAPLQPADHDLQVAAYRLSVRDLNASIALLKPLEERIRAVEERRVANLRLRAKQGLVQFAGRPSLESWHDAIERALAGTRIDEVEALLEAGPNGIVVAEADYPPPLPVGSLAWASLAEMCDWSLTKKGGSARFYQVWDPLRDNDRAKPLMERLRGVATEASLTEEDAASFGRELQRLLSDDAAPPRVQTVEGGFVVTIRGLTDMASSAFSARGIDLYIQRKDGEVDLAPRRDVAILFSLGPVAELPSGYAILTPGDLIRCLSRLSGLRFNLLRILSRQIPESRIFPSESRPPLWPHDEAQPVAWARLRALAKRVFVLHGFEANDSEIDRLVFYACGHPSLLHAVLRALFHDLDRTGKGREARIQMDVVNKVHRSHIYKQAVRSALQAPAERSPDTHRTLAAILVLLHLTADDPDADGSIEESEIKDWLSEAVDLPKARFEASLNELSGLRLILREAGKIRLLTSGGGYVVAAMIENVQAYWDSASRR